MIIDTVPMALSKSSTVKSDCSGREAELTREDILQRISKKRWNMSTGHAIEFPPLNCRDDLAAWVARVEDDLMDRDVSIPRSQWADAAILYLVGPLNMLMRQQRARRMEAGGSDTWMWEDFQASLSQLLEERDCRTAIQSFREDHPIAAAAVATSLLTAGGIAIAPAVVVGGLNAVGFTASGVAGGSLAAGIQSSVYGGLTTGLFSACQSIGATWVVGSGSVISGIGSLAAGATVLPSSHKTKTSSDSATDMEDGNRSTSSSPPPYR